MRKRQKPSIVHVLEIATSPEVLWRALTDGAITRLYWEGRRADSTWNVGSVVTFWYSRDGAEAVSERGIVLECRPPRRLSYSFHAEFVDELIEEHPSRMSFDLVAIDRRVRLTLVHDEFEPGSKVFELCCARWPAILGGLKTLLETGQPRAAPAEAGAAAAGAA